MLYKTTNQYLYNTFCHFCLCQINRNDECYYHNIMTFCSKSCFDLLFYEIPNEYKNRNKNMFGLLVDGRVNQFDGINICWHIKQKIKKFFKILRMSIKIPKYQTYKNHP